jgi:hypothetical protein
MKAGGLLFLFAGWVIVLGAVCLLRSRSAIGIFAAAGMAVELLGLALTVRSHAGGGRRP